jgi:sugar fermentation stimulation protein A
MRLEAPLLEASLVERENRFRARVLLRDEEVAAHVPNSGRLTELFSPGQPVLVREAGAPHRVTDYDLLMVRLAHELVSVDARLPNKLFSEAVAAGTLAEFAGLKVEKGEFVQGDSRLDFLLKDETSGERCLVEVKSVTLVQGAVARFPDAVTERGRRHLFELRDALSKGMRAAVVFVVQRGDARLFAPHWESDPEFGEQLRWVARDGVEVYAYGCRVSQQEVRLSYRLPVVLSTGEGVEAGGRVWSTHRVIPSL